MHEMSLAEGVLQLIEDAAHRDGFKKVSTVWLEIGQLSAVEPEALAFCFDAVTRGTVADGARLEIITLPGQGWCEACCQTIPMTELLDACPVCGACPIEVTAGAEMRVKELEVS